jgi:hypothetical protein
LDSANDKIEFIFHTTAIGNFGSSGVIWKGDCSLHNNQLSLKVLEKNDWRFTAVQEEKEENIQKLSRLFNFEILKENDNIFLVSVWYEKTIKLARLYMNIDRNRLYSIVYWIIQEIINQNKLKEGPLEFEPSRFWRISNLLLKSYNEININEKNAIEILFEYDLEFVKEEKRVIENDEIHAEHYLDKAIFDFKFNKVNYKNLE